MAIYKLVSTPQACRDVLTITYSVHVCNIDMCEYVWSVVVHKVLVIQCISYATGNFVWCVCTIYIVLVLLLHFNFVQPPIII